MDDAAMPLTAHVGKHRHHHMERSPEIGVHRVLIIRQLHVVQRVHLDNPRVVDEDIDRSEPMDRDRDGTLGVTFQPDISLHGQHFRIGPFVDDRSRRALHLFLVTRDECQPCAFRRQLTRDDEPKPSRPSGDDD
jgi:hypothetical protein